MNGDEKDEILSEQEIARRRDEIIRRMANTPPDPKTKRELDATPKKRGHSKRKDRAENGN